MREIFVAVGFLAGATGITVADTGADCAQSKDPTLSVKACSLLIHGIVKTTQRAEAHNNRGGSYLVTGEYDKAITDYKQAVAIKPNYPIAFYNLGIAYQGKGDHDRAILSYSQAILLGPANADAYNGRGWSYQIKQDYKSAIADYEKALSLKPKHELAVINRRNAQTLLDKQLSTQIIQPPSEVAELQSKDPHPINIKSAATGARIALVIGNGAYTGVSQLTNARNDARAIAASLTRLGFEVIAKDDLSAADMRAAFAEFETRAANADWALVYYAGHGIEMNGRNWLLPTDAKLARASDIADEAVALDRVLERVRPAKVLRMVILDACRNNPFVAKMDMGRTATRSVDRGLARIEPQNGEVVFYAARDGSVAADGDGANSPFATAFVKHLDEDGLELSRFFRRVTGSVRAATKNVQEPFVYGTLPDVDFYFKPPVVVSK